MAKLVSVNVGLPRPIDTPRGPVQTAIFKSPTEQRLQVEAHNLEGDRQGDLAVHGGENKAVYGYPIEHYPLWAAALQRSDLEPGQFGENLTTDGLLEREVAVGDIFLVGSARLQVTQPRAPCFKLGIRMGDPRFVKTFLRSGRPGMYFRIEESGALAVGDTIARVERGAAGLTVWDVWHLAYGGGTDRDRMNAALEIPTLGDEWRRPILAKLAT